MALAILALVSLQATVLGKADVRARATQSEPPRKARVLVRDNYFEPRSTEILEGGRVYWKWRGHNRHSIRFTKVPKGAPRRGARARTEGRWKRRFRQPGVYRYVCRLWAGMRGTVTVRVKTPAQQSKRRR